MGEGRIFVAWVDKTETVFGPQHQRRDVHVYSLVRRLTEGEFPSLECDVEPEVQGLLNPDRKQWVWVSYERAPGDVVPLFFGRVLGIPTLFGDDLWRLHFEARPQDYEAQKEALAAGMRDLPWFDPLWLSEAEGERLDPDRVLEARSQLFVVDPVSHEVAVSDIIVGEAGNVLFGLERFVDSDSIRMSPGRAPARKAVVTAAVRWRQRGTGEIDVTPDLAIAAAAVTPPQVRNLDGHDFDTAGMLVLAAGEEMVRAWPLTGRRIGAGWEVGRSRIGPVGPTPTMGIVGSEIAFAQIVGRVQGGDPSYRSVFSRGPGLIVPIAPLGPTGPEDPFGAPPQIVWLPLWTLAAELKAAWSADRQRTETVEFEVTADVQPTKTDPGDDDIIRLDFGPASVDQPVAGEEEPPTDLPTEIAAAASPIGDPRRPTYWKTDRGKQSLAHLMARARAALLDRARCVEVGFEGAFDHVIDLTLRHSATLVDPLPDDSVLPGAQASGKVVQTELVVDGDTGDFLGRVLLACSVGRGGQVEASAGTPTYSEPGYGTPGYETWQGEVVSPLAGDLAFEDFGDQPIDDDGVNLLDINRLDHVVSCEISGGLVQEEQQVPHPGGAFGPAGWGTPVGFVPYRTAQEVVDRIAAIETTIRLEMRPVTGGPFETVLKPVITPLFVPRTIDLEGPLPTEGS